MAHRRGRDGSTALGAALLLSLLGGCHGSAPSGSCEAALGLDESGCALVQSMRLPDGLPPARGNAHGDSDDAAQLGFQFFFRADAGHGVSCATCHDPTFGFSDRRAVPQGHEPGTRNTPTTLNAARLKLFFWDGRADSLWSQALFPIENPLEMASSRLELSHYLAGDPLLGPLYARAFGAMPDLSALPPAGKPGDPAFDALSAAAKDTVNRIAANLGKAVEAYERKNSSGTAPLDRYLDGDASAITGVAREGLARFVRAGCTNCHAGPMFTDDKFHAAGFPPLDGGAADPGAAQGVVILGENVFNLAGPYADAAADGGVPPLPDLSGAVEGAFRTPSLRRVADTPPYGHAGSIATLDDLLVLHAPGLTAEERGQLTAFLRTLSGDLPPRPWSTWPSPQ